MSEDKDRAMEAARLYASDKTFKDIAEHLGTSKSHAQVLVRRGIELLESEKSDPSTIPPENPDAHQGDSGDNPFPFETNRFNFPQDPRIGAYTLETEGIGRRVLLTPKAIMIYDLWRGAGFTGDLSDFLEDAVNFMYDSRRPSERLNY